MRSWKLFTLLLVYASYTAAWPWPPSIQGVEGLILKRQDNNVQSSTPSATPSASPSSAPSNTIAPVTASITGSPTTSDPASGSVSGSLAGNSNGASQTASQTASVTDKQTGKPQSTTSKPKPTEIDPRLPAGGIQMLEPPAISSASYYKIGTQISFAWNYTSLVVTPTAVDILVSCSANSATYTLASNASVKETGSVIWDTGVNIGGKDPLLTDTYTLIIHDAAKAITAFPSAGYLGTYNQFTFGMYKSHSYTPLPGFVCVTCSGALSSMEQQTIKFVFGMVATTIISFTWFAGSFGVY